MSISEELFGLTMILAAYIVALPILGQSIKRGAFRSHRKGSTDQSSPIKRGSS